MSLRIYIDETVVSLHEALTVVNRLLSEIVKREWG